MLARLLSHPDAHSFDITIFIRDPAKAKVAEEKFGLKYVIGTLAEEDKIEALAEKAHIVFSCVGI